MTKRSEKNDCYSKLAKEAMSEVNTLIKQIDYVSPLLDEKKDNNILHRLAGQKADLTSQLESVKDAANAMQSQYNFVKTNELTKSKLTVSKTVAGLARHPILASKALSMMYQESNRIGNSFDSAKHECKVNTLNMMEDLRKTQALMDSVVNMPEIAPKLAQKIEQNAQNTTAELRDLIQEFQDENEEIVAPNFHDDVDQDDDFNELDELDDFYQENFKDFEPAAPLNDIQRLEINEAALNLELEQENDNQAEITVGNTNDDTSPKLKM